MVSSEEIKRRLKAKRDKTYSEEEKTTESSSKVVCSQCQTENLGTAKFCVGCGSPLVKEEAPTEIPTTPSSTTEAPSEPDYKLCPSCNQKNKIDAKFCIICGHKFTTENTEKPMESLVDVVTDEKMVTPGTPGAETPINETGTIPEQETSPVENVTPPESETPPIETTHSEEQVVPEIKVPKQYQKEEPSTDEITPELASTEEAPLKETLRADETEETPEDPIEKIKKAKELLDIGAITQEEYDRIKNKYLELI
ncbi:MAG: hypothetical protein PWQ15_1168 [Methanobacterium sp.]|uniref:double zinc ribbon domain-containing protein n=1 Tax=Methanobacterium sp. TaxID=2164 RepID=UPI0024AA62F2|nr:zinc ribbon domain-containing protein [Methanobacterium sp.]MDI3550066.1 hypothetical protein [Methanobacterium sp.]